MDHQLMVTDSATKLGGIQLHSIAAMCLKHPCLSRVFSQLWLLNV